MLFYALRAYNFFLDVKKNILQILDLGVFYNAGLIKQN